MNKTQCFLIGLIAPLLMTACDQNSGNQTKHRSLADAAAQLRSNAMVDTTWRGHLSWNGNARILKSSDCYLLDRDYTMVGIGDGVTLRLVYRAEQSGVANSVRWDSPVLVELQFDEDGAEDPYYRAAAPVSEATDITIEDKLIFGTARLEATNDAARRDHPGGVEAEFEFRCT
jgi:hypothetical protein